MNGVEAGVARLISWNHERGFGWLAVTGNRSEMAEDIFVHVSAFEGRVPPEVGALVEFTIGTDRRGRECAVGARIVTTKGRGR